MTAWLIRSTLQPVETGSPAEMAAGFGAAAWTDANGNAQSNAVAVFQPDLTAVKAQPTKYWVLTGDVVSLMTAQQMAAVDAAATSAQYDATTAALSTVSNVQRAVLLVILDEFNRHTAYDAAVASAVAAATTLANLKTAWAALTPVPTRAASDLITAVRAKLGT